MQEPVKADDYRLQYLQEAAETLKNKKAINSRCFSALSEEEQEWRIQGLSKLTFRKEQMLCVLETGFVKMGRNQPCFCGSGKKYKKCHMILMRNSLSFHIKLKAEEILDE